MTYDGQYRYYYDCENRLIDVNDTEDEPVVTYAYDFAGRRVRKTLHGEPNVVTTYLYDGWRCIREYTEGGAVIRSYFYGVGLDEPVWSNGSGNIYYYHYDGLGSVIALSKGDGTVVERYTYNAFGGVTIRGPGAEPRETSLYGNPYMFTGRRLDPETGNYYYRYRYYNAELGRFLEADPLGLIAGLNLYAYVGNNPIVQRDPYGLTPRLDLAPFPPPPRKPRPPRPPIDFDFGLDNYPWSPWPGSGYYPNYQPEGMHDEAAEELTRRLAWIWGPPGWFKKPVDTLKAFKDWYDKVTAPDSVPEQPEVPGDVNSPPDSNTPVKKK